MTDLAYGHGVRPPSADGVRLHDANLLTDIDYAELLLKLADQAVRHRDPLDGLLFALCWARFNLTATGTAARHTISLSMDRCDVRNSVEDALHDLLGRDERVPKLTDWIIDGMFGYSPVLDEAAQNGRHGSQERVSREGESA